MPKIEIVDREMNTERGDKPWQPRAQKRPPNPTRPLTKAPQREHKHAESIRNKIAPKTNPVVSDERQQMGIGRIERLCGGLHKLQVFGHKHMDTTHHRNGASGEYQAKANDHKQ